MRPTLSVVIPALDEAERLPALLDALDRQTRPPDQVVVADAGSTDGTRTTAEARGALVVPGGKPAAGRNAGAAVASGDLVLFLDADVELEDDFAACALEEFGDRGLVAATAHVEPVERDARNVFACEVVDFYLDVMQYVAPHAPGFCILARRDVHLAIGGFDETVVLAEDHDYVQRAAERGKFRVLHSVSVRTSMRRIDKEGLVRLAFKYLYCELYVVTGTPIRDVPFDYEFASFSPEERAERLLDIGALRERLGDLAETVVTLSADGRRALAELGSLGMAPHLPEGLLAQLPTDDVRALRRYVKARVRLARRGPRRVLARVRRAGGDVWRLLTITQGARRVGVDGGTGEAKERTRPP